MLEYNYKVKNQAGRTLIGTMSAENERIVVSRLREQGNIVLEIVQAGTDERKSENHKLFSKRKITTKDIAIMSRQFATMVNAGVPLVQCLAILKDQSENVRLQEVMKDIALDVESGNTLTSSFRKQKDIFPELFINLLQVGETTGSLDAILDKLADFYEREYELREKVRSAMVYPIFVMVMALLITTGLVVFVLPVFENVFNDLNVELPLLTKCLLGLSRMIRSFWYIWPIPLFLVVYQVRKYLKSTEGNLKFEAIVIRLPVIGNLSTKLSFSRFTMSMAIMLETGVPMLQALEVARDTLGNVVYAREIDKLKDEVQGGGSIALFMDRNKLFPPMMAKMIAVGENTGSLDTMLNKISQFYERETKYIIERLSSLLEPFMIGFLGITVGLIVISIMLPMFSIIGGIQ
ncbi:MAG: type II secretion system F family protein [bacterium]